MRSISFDAARPVVESDPARTDVACFVGLARATGTALPRAIQDWLQLHGWCDGLASSLATSVLDHDTEIVLSMPMGTDLGFISIGSEVMDVSSVDPAGTTMVVERGTRGTKRANHPAGAQVQGAVNPGARPICPPFTDIPIPMESYATFTALFDAGGSSASFGTDYLAAAVRSFFAQGGRRCYVVRMDDPLAPEDSAPEGGMTRKSQKLAALLPGMLYAADDRRSWHGVGHLGGLPDVSFLAVPDLPVLSASDPAPGAGLLPTPLPGPARFMECSPPEVIPAPQRLFLLPAPRLTPDDYKLWSQNAQTILEYLSRNGIREIQFVAAFPLPREVDAVAAAANPSSLEMAQDIHSTLTTWMHENILPMDTEPPQDPGLSTAFLQLSYPWLKTSGSWVLNESLEPPDGALVGIQSRNALTRGAFMDATKVVPAEISDVWPPLPSEETAAPTAPLIWGDDSWKPLVVRLSLFGFTAAGLRLLSDVTAYPGEAYRPARVHRLVSVISRAARQLGDRIVFGQNGPTTWTCVENSLGQLMTQLWRANALEGATVQEAFSVRCDSSTMTQNDLDNGRLIAQVTFTAAATIESVRVTLALETSGASAQGVAVMAGAS